MGLWEKSGRDFQRYSRFILPFALTAIMLTVISVGWFTQPDRFVRGYEPVQPISFSHQLHPGTLRIPCIYCHTGVLTSRLAGIPPVEKCMNCHKVTKTDKPEIKMLTARYDSNESLQWKRIHSLPDHVYFDHRPHVYAGILCPLNNFIPVRIICIHFKMTMRINKAVKSVE